MKIKIKIKIKIKEVENRAALGWLAQLARVRFPGITLTSLTGVHP
jgi:hypothetical protein